LESKVFVWVRQVPEHGSTCDLTFPTLRYYAYNKWASVDEVA